MEHRTFLAIRVVVDGPDGLYTRDYVRHNDHEGRDRFIAWAVGDMLLTVGAVDGNPTKVRFEEISFDTVVENRKYGHTSHTEAGALR